MSTRTPKPEIVTRITNDIVAEVGSWGIGECGDQGIADLVWDHYEPYQRLDEEQQRLWLNAVRVELGWGPA
jgi:hypothetical protein